MTGRGRAALLLGVGLYLAAWLLGARPLYPVALGLLGAPLVASMWVRLAARPLRIERHHARAHHLEGDDLEIDVDAALSPGLRPVGLRLNDRLGSLGRKEVALEVEGRRAWGRYTLHRVPRGRYALDQATVTLEDPFGLARVEAPVPSAGALLVYPRLEELDGLFSETGRTGQQGRRLLVRRPTGMELHAVREHEEGESLRRVHWPSTAKRSRLMVKDLEDAPRDELAVVLDAQAGVSAGEPPDSSFDAQVRAAGSIVQSLARSGRRSLLAIHAATPAVLRVASYDGDWPVAYDALAAAEPTAVTPLTTLLGAEGGPVARAAELVVVSSLLPPATVDSLARRAAAGRRTSLVLVDASTFAGKEREPRADLLRLAAAGVAVARVSRGDDLAAVLGGHLDTRVGAWLGRRSSGLFPRSSWPACGCASSSRGARAAPSRSCSSSACCRRSSHTGPCGSEQRCRRRCSRAPWPSTCACATCFRSPSRFVRASRPACASSTPSGCRSRPSGTPTWRGSSPSPSSASRS